MTIKHQLYKYCVRYVEKRIETAKEAMDAAQEAVMSEDKISVGDHHETGRAMMQLEKENIEKQLVEALKLKDALGTINPDKSSQVVTRGSLVSANNTNYYISISAGKIIIDKTVYFAVSPESPIGQALWGLKKGDSLWFNNQRIEILEVV